MPTVDPFLRPLSELADEAFLSVDESATYEDILGRLRDAHAGSLVVTRGGRVCGVFTERDVLNKCLLEGIRPGTPVRELMTGDPAVLPLDATVADAVALMHAKHIRNVPLVAPGGAPKALLTVGRLIRFLAYAFPAEVVNLPPRPSQVTEEVEGA